MMNENQQKPLSKYAAKKQQRVSLWNDEFSKKKANPKPFKPRPKPLAKKPEPPAPLLSLKEALVAMGYEDGVMKWPCCDPKIQGRYLTYRICQLDEVGHEVWKKASIGLDGLKAQLEKKQKGESK